MLPFQHQQEQPQQIVSSFGTDEMQEDDQSDRDQSSKRHIKKEFEGGDSEEEGSSS
jgi:hypothetical protein